MARPKSTTPPKGKLTISVTEQTRAELAFLAQDGGKSASQIIAELVAKQAKKVAKAKGVEAPDAAQLSLLEV